MTMHFMWMSSLDSGLAISHVGLLAWGMLVSVFSGRDSANMACNIRLVTGVDYLYLNVWLQMAILRWYRTFMLHFLLDFEECLKCFQ